jgi:hypothetical protein
LKWSISVQRNAIPEARSVNELVAHFVESYQMQCNCSAKES